MNIGFDAKRAFLNASGLGNYSRSVIRSLVQYYPGHSYYLFTPSQRNSPANSSLPEGPNVHTIIPTGLLDKKLSARWRSFGITRLLEKNKIEVYHGLSNELPFNIRKFKGKKIVTIHDLIFLRCPKLYPAADRLIYNKKFRHACQAADRIIAVSEQTKSDITEFYSIDPEKITVIYQSCSPAFDGNTDPAAVPGIRKKYNLPGTYLLNVGTVEARKNLGTIVKALASVKDIPLVVVGKKKAYYKKVQEIIAARKLKNRVVFADNVLPEDLPALYKGAEIFIYPSLFEGFGIPVLEALTCRTPVITTRGGCFAEAGGPGSVYVDPNRPDEMAAEINRLLSSSEIRKKMAETGYAYSKKFTPQVISSHLMNAYLP